jgi:CBS domain-containing protein
MADAPLRVRELFLPAHALVRSRARTIPDVAAQLVALLVESGAASSSERLLERLEAARPEDMVTAGDRAVLLHFRTDAAARMGLAIATLAAPIVRDEEDRDAQIDLVVVLISPRRLAARHLRLVRALERALDAEDTRRALLAAETPAALAQVRALTAIDLPPGLAVADVMTEEPRSIDADRALPEAIALLRQANVSDLPVLDAERRVLGLFGERELLRLVTTRYLTGVQGAPRVAPLRPESQVRVREVMTRQVWCVAPEQPLAEVAALMLHRDIARVPVVDGGRLVGFLTRGDVARRLLDA